MKVIDADKLKEIIEYQQTINPKLSVYDVIKLIDNAPTIKTFTLADIEEQYRKGLEKGLSEWEAERPTGEWIRHDEWRGGEYIGGFYHVNCPVEDGYYSKWETNYCPNCGAQMKMKGADK